MDTRARTPMDTRQRTPLGTRAQDVQRYSLVDAYRPLPAVDDSRSTTIKKDDDAYESWPAYEDSRFTTIKKEDDAYESWPAYEDSVYITIKREETDPFKALEEVGKKLRVQANWHPSMGKPSSDNDPNWYPGKGIHSHLTKMPRQNPHDDKPRNPKRREDCRNEPAGSRHACFERKHEHHEHERDLLAKGELGMRCLETASHHYMLCPFLQ
jgi:hypothetical protein